MNNKLTPSKYIKIKSNDDVTLKTLSEKTEIPVGTLRDWINKGYYKRVDLLISAVKIEILKDKWNNEHKALQLNGAL